MSRRVPDFKDPTKGQAPLRLGERGDGRAVLEAKAVDPEHCELEVGGPLTKRGAAHLARWLFAFSKPPVTLWTVSGIAKECSISRPQAHNWTRHPTFPKPWKIVGGGDAWESGAVKDWVARRPKVGRQKKARRKRSI